MKKLGVFKDFSDGTLKSVFDIGVDKIIEISLLFNKDDMDVVCVPTHHFCNMGCKMCHLTNNQLKKAMVPIYYKDFVKCLEYSVTDIKYHQRRTDKKKLLISFMGVGEPLLNLDLIKDIYLHEEEIKEKLCYEQIGYALSTMMPNNNVLKLKEMVNELNIPLKLHFSLHTPIDEDRKELIPNTKVSVKEAFEYLNNYKNTMLNNKEFQKKYIEFHRTNIPVEIHYTLIRNINDRYIELEKLIELEKEYCIPIKFIKFNPINKLEISKNEEKWTSKLKEIPNLRVKTYAPPGKEVGSSCGEFTKHYYHSSIETIEEYKSFEKWKEKHEIFE